MSRNITINIDRLFDRMETQAPSEEMTERVRQMVHEALAKAVQDALPMEKECPEPRGNKKTAVSVFEVREQLRLLREKIDKNRDPLCQQSARLRSGISQLHQILGVLPAENEGHQAETSTASVAFEIQIAKHISKFLADADGHTPDVAHIQDLLRDYRAVRPLPSGSCAVSLGRVHSIVQDNFSGSSLCLFLNMMLGAYPEADPLTVVL